MTSESLFDSRTHRDSEPKRHGEGSFNFLNRVQSKYFAAVRDMLEEWFSYYSAADRARLRREFRGADVAHEGAFLELYLHELHRRLGFTLWRDPSIAGTDRSPDFLLKKGNISFYLEATVVGGRSQAQVKEDRAKENLYSIVNEVRSPDFGLELEFVVVGTRDPARNPLIDEIEAFLASLDPTKVSTPAPGQRFTGLPSKEVCAGDWVLRVVALPLKHEARGNPERRALGVFPPEGGVIDSVTPLRNALKAKAGRYGRPDRPYVIALNWLDKFADDHSVPEVLWGTEAVRMTTGDPAQTELIRQPNGFLWRGRPDNTRVSAVLTVTQLRPWTVGSVSPMLWSNSWASRPMPPGALEWDSTYVDVQSGTIHSVDGFVQAPEILGLAGNWPPGEPFRAGD